MDDTATLAQSTLAGALGLRVQVASIALALALYENDDPAICELRDTSKRLLLTLDLLDALCAELRQAADETEALGIGRRINFECREARDLTGRFLKLLPALRAVGTQGNAPVN